jgi:SAM-dependent methyltransferase
MNQEKNLGNSEKLAGTSFADLPKELKDRLICPICSGKVIIDRQEISCLDDGCGVRFPIIDKVPILINEEDSVFSIKDYFNNSVSLASTKLKIKEMAKHFLKYLPTLSNNISSDKNFNLLVNLLSKKTNPKILIVGGAVITKDTEKLITPNNVVVESDVYIGPRTQIIFDGHHIPFENETFDLVIYQAVLEHVADPYQCVKEAHRILKSDGLVFATTPFMQQVHLRAYDFTRFTHLGHRRLFRQFLEIESGVFAGPGVALGWSIKYFFNAFTTNTYLRNIITLTVSTLFFWLKYADFLTFKMKGSYDAASGFYFIGKKSKTVLSDKELIKLFRGN